MRLVHVVTGPHRSGTSMLMAATALSGQIEVAKSASIEAVIRAREVDRANYDPNPNGYYASETDDPTIYSGQVVKVPLYQWPSIPEVNDVRYKVLLTRRDAGEIKQSFIRSFGVDLSDNWMLRRWEAGEENLLSRKDCDVIVVDFATMIANPIGEFSRLVTEGWPVDVELAAGSIDAALYRNRLV